MTFFENFFQTILFLKKKTLFLICLNDIIFFEEKKINFLDFFFENFLTFFEDFWIFFENYLDFFEIFWEFFENFGNFVKYFFVCVCVGLSPHPNGQNKE